MKKIIILVGLMISLTSCAELQDIASQLPQDSQKLTQQQIGNGLREALNKGIEKEVTKLTQTNGFYRNEAVKIMMPQELQKVESGLRKVGLGSLADEGIKALNRAAEDAVKEATPIFISAVKDMSFSDAKNILMGNDRAATSYLEMKTTSQLYDKFNPVIQNSFKKVGADQIWSNLISRYNKIPLTEKVNPDLTDYVTNNALDGVFKMISKEEIEIRNNLSERSSNLLKRVFALQDKNS